MAKTSKNANAKPEPAVVTPHLRAHEVISEMLRSTTSEESLRICKEAGIIATDSKLSATYKSWGKRPTTPPTYEQLTGEK